MPELALFEDILTVMHFIILFSNFFMINANWIFLFLLFINFVYFYIELNEGFQITLIMPLLIQNILVQI